MKEWDKVRQEILQTVFPTHDQDIVLKSANLLSDGLMDSLSIVLILTILDEAKPSSDYVSKASADDFRSLAAIEMFYQRTAPSAANPEILPE